MLHISRGEKKYLKLKRDFILKALLLSWILEYLTQKEEENRGLPIFVEKKTYRFREKTNYEQKLAQGVQFQLHYFLGASASVSVSWYVTRHFFSTVPSSHERFLNKSTALSELTAAAPEARLWMVPTVLL